MKLELDKINDKFDKATSSPVNTKDEAIQAFREHIGVYYPNCIYKDFKAVRKPNGSFDIIFKHKRKDGYDTRYYYCTYNVNLNTNKVIHVSGTLEGMCNF